MPVGLLSLPLNGHMLILPRCSGGLAGGARGPWAPSGLFEMATKIQKVVKDFMKFDVLIMFFPAPQPRSRSHRPSIQIHLMEMHQSLSKINHFKSMLSFVGLTQTVIQLATAFM